MAKYLNPKADLTFKKVFGEHKDLSTRFAALYGYPQRLMNDKYVVMFLKDYADSLPIECLLNSLDKYWDQISRERTAVNAAERKGRVEGRAEGRVEEKVEIAKKLKTANQELSFISQITGLSENEIELL